MRARLVAAARETLVVKRSNTQTHRLFGVIVLTFELINNKGIRGVLMKRLGVNMQEIEFFIYSRYIFLKIHIPTFFKRYANFYCNWNTKCKWLAELRIICLCNDFFLKKELIHYYSSFHFLKIRFFIFILVLLLSVTTFFSYFNARFE